MSNSEALCKSCLLLLVSKQAWLDFVDTTRNTRVMHGDREVQEHYLGFSGRLACPRFFYAGCPNIVDP